MLQPGDERAATSIAGSHADAGNTTAMGGRSSRKQVHGRCEPRDRCRRLACDVASGNRAVPVANPDWPPASETATARQSRRGNRKAENGRNRFPSRSAGRPAASRAERSVRAPECGRHNAIDTPVRRATDDESRRQISRAASAHRCGALPAAVTKAESSPRTPLSYPCGMVSEWFKCRGFVSQ